LTVQLVERIAWAGAVVLPAVFTEEDLALARKGQEAYYRGEMDLTPGFSWPAPRPATSRSRKHPYASFFRSELAALARSSILAERIREVTGFDELRFWHDQLLWEEPRAAAKGEVENHWHTERSRWKTCEAALMVTAWIPLDEVTAAMGPITMVEGSEQLRWIDLPEAWVPEEQERRAMVLRPGAVSLHCWHTIHGNPPNFGASPRRVLAAHFACGPVSYQHAGKFSHVNERVVRQIAGVPDFADERVCPRLGPGPTS
jgi:ectoine hydroxylase-related dioxygenase (phytanoyl-CoA dioxygenase family)